MLTEIRDRSSGVFAWVIAALIIIPMAFWGVQEYASTEAVPIIVEVGDEKISQNQYQQQLANAQARERERNPNLANSDVLNGDFFKRRVLQDLINRAALRDVAQKQNYRIGDQQLAKIIKDSSLFQKDGKFDQNAYETYLQSQSFSKNQFETNVRTDSRLSQVTTGFQESALVLPDEVRELLEIQSEERTFDLITINKADFVDSITVTDADIEEYYNGNTDDFAEPDRMSISYLELDIDTLAAGVTVTEEEVRAVYEENVDSFVSNESRSTRHILLSSGGSEKDSDQLKKAEALVAELRGGGDFAALAKENSQDPGSANNGGSLGDVELGQMVPEFEAATFDLTEGEISDPVKTQFGYHIIQVESINASEPQSFEEVRFDLEQDERDRKAQDALADKIEQLRNLVFEQPDSLEAAAEALELELKTSTLFARDAGEGIAANEAVRALAFSEQVLQDGINAEPIELSSDRYMALRKNEFVASTPKPLADVSAQIKSILTDKRASLAAENQGDSVLEKAKTDWASLASDESVKISTQTVSMIDNERQVSNDVLRHVLKAQLENDAPTVSSLTGLGGDFHIVRLSKVAPGNLNSVSEQVKDATRRLVAQRNGASMLNSYIRNLSSTTASDINEDLL